MEGESLERSEHYVSGPSHCLHVVGDRYCHYVRRVVGVGELCAALVVRLLDERNLRYELHPGSVPEYTGTSQVDVYGIEDRHVRSGEVL